MEFTESKSINIYKTLIYTNCLPAIPCLTFSIIFNICVSVATSNTFLKKKKVKFAYSLKITGLMGKIRLRANP